MQKKKARGADLADILVPKLTRLMTVGAAMFTKNTPLEVSKCSHRCLK